MKKDIKWIRETFDRDGIHAPESLSKEAIEKKLEGIRPEDRDSIRFAKPESALQMDPGSTTERDQKGHGKRSAVIRGMIGVAACLLLVTLIAPTAYHRLTGMPDMSPVDGELYTFQSYGEMKRLVDKLTPGGYGWGKSGFGRYSMETELALEDAGTTADAVAGEPGDTADAAMNESAVSEGTGSVSSESGAHSSTYLQVEDVDEADIVKTDGQYIYYVNRKKEIVILEAKDGNTEKVATISNGSTENYIHDIFLKDDLLVAVGVAYDGNEESSAVVTYDISSRAEPKEISVFRQSGEIVSSRMIGNFVYLVTSEFLNRDESILPKTTTGGKFTDMKISDICVIPEPETPSCVILSSIDVASGDAEKCQTRAVFGTSQDIYCNNRNLFVAATEYGENYREVRTRIVRAALDGKKIRFEATGTVPGRIDDQFSMDEKDGYFRIATTSTRDGMDVNNLFVLDADLNEVGKVTGFARDESIRSVRYIGDKAYVITFEQVDPLFIIDLSDPAHPVIEGEVEIDGFSTLLVPVREDRLLGIGYLTKDNGYGGVMSDGLKLTLFHIGDPSRPEVLDTKEFPGMFSPAQSTHLALMRDPDGGYDAIPYRIDPGDVAWIDNPDEEAGETVDETTGTGTSMASSGVLVFGADDRLTVYDQHGLTEDMLLRCVFIGDWIYALDEQGTVYSFLYSLT